MKPKTSQRVLLRSLKAVETPEVIRVQTIRSEIGDKISDRKTLTFANCAHALSWLQQAPNPEHFSNLTLRAFSNGSEKTSVSFDILLSENTAS